MYLNHEANGTGAKRVRSTTPIKEVEGEEDLEELLSHRVHIGDESQLGNGFALRADHFSKMQENAENQFILNDQRNGVKQIQSRAAQKSDPNSSETSGHFDSKNSSVFKSANWISDSELIFSLSNQVGGLVRALRIFQELDIGIKHVESRKSKRRSSEFEIFVDIDCSDQEKMKKLVHHLR